MEFSFLNLTFAMFNQTEKYLNLQDTIIFFSNYSKYLSTFFFNQYLNLNSRFLFYVLFQLIVNIMIIIRKVIRAENVES